MITNVTYMYPFLKRSFHSVVQLRKFMYLCIQQIPNKLNRVSFLVHSRGSVKKKALLYQHTVEYGVTTKQNQKGEEFSGRKELLNNLSRGMLLL